MYHFTDYNPYNTNIEDISKTITDYTNNKINNTINNTIKALANSSMEELYLLHQETTNEDLKRLIERIVI